MLLAFDIGNTNIVLGCFEESELKHVFRLKTDSDRTLDEYSAILFSLFDRHFGSSTVFSKCIISSVVPPVTPDIVRFVSERLNIQPLVVGPGIKTGCSINTHEPAAVGSDRIVNAVAAKTLFGTPALVVDFGTATTIDVVSPKGAYEGGAIIPGVRISLDALFARAAKLPRIEIAWPESAIGKNTVQAMQSGAIMGYMSLVDGMLERVISEMGPVEHIIATGGIGKLFSEHSKHIKSYEPDLTLKGLQILADLNDSPKVG